MSKRNHPRPVHLDLLRIRLPVGGVVSILHRFTGVLLVLLLPVGFFLLQQSLASVESFAQVRVWFHSLPARFLLYGAALILLHHFFAGLRHLLLDLDIGISRVQSRASAWLVFASVAVLGVLLGWRLFL